MNYKELLEEYINKSGLSHREISRRSKDLGTPVSQGYISQLVRGDVPPPSEEITKVLTQITGGDSKKLLWYGYIEKAPQEVQPIIRWYLDKWDEYVKIVTELHEDPNLSKEEQDLLSKEMHDKINNMPIEEQINFVISRFIGLSMGQSDYFASIGESSGFPKEEIKESIHYISQIPIIRIKVYNLLNNTEYYEWISAENLKLGNYVYAISPDDSMIGAHINKGSKVLCKLIDFEDAGNDVSIFVLEVGKIYLVALNDKKLIRRVFSMENTNNLTLQAENPKYPPIIVNPEDNIELIAIAESVEINPNEF